VLHAQITVGKRVVLLIIRVGTKRKHVIVWHGHPRRCHGVISVEHLSWINVAAERAGRGAELRHSFGRAARTGKTCIVPVEHILLLRLRLWLSKWLLAPLLLAAKIEAIVVACTGEWR
jgi:hypothetical protein